ncbi:MAG: hypothetical protein K0U40_02300 [Betaproteobacteria bacterium]|nr:hypothetical protein [Betaproteobacteria bacterium]
MKQRIKLLVLSIGSLFLMSNMHSAFSDTATDAETLLNWAEKTFPQFFPSNQATQNIEPFLFRHYPETDIYVGVNQNDNGVYGLGGIWGNNPTFIDNLPNLLGQISNSGGNGDIAACDTTNTPAGISYSQSGNVISVTTNGQCVSVPDLNTTSICQVPQQTIASGISVLSSNTVTSSRMDGITTTVPGLPNPFQAIVDATASIKHCTINATSEAANQVVNSDLCFDITSALSALLADFTLEGISVTPPVNYFFTGTYMSQAVNDCFATDATTISDAFTGEAWVKQNGSFVKVGN